MRHIKTTTVDKEGNLVHNDDLFVLIHQDYEAIVAAQKAGMEVHATTGQRFDILEKIISLQEDKLNILEAYTQEILKQLEIMSVRIDFRKRVRK